MDEKKIYDLIERFEKSKLTVMKIEKDDVKIHLEKGGILAPIQEAPIIQTQVSSQINHEAAITTQATENSYEKVKSPIVGVFYEAPSPNDAPYVKLGDRVTKGQILCLVEAMKMMNELKSPVDGVIKTINGKNGELVEFDQVIFEVEEC